VRRFYEALDQGTSVREVASRINPLLHPEAEYVNPPDALEPGTHQGPAGWSDVLESVLEGLGETATFKVRELVEEGDRVFVTIALRTGGTASGVQVAGPTIGAVWTLEDGLLRRFEWFWDPADARARFDGSR
jgi:ketosteroid isomerase-like protein